MNGFSDVTETENTIIGWISEKGIMELEELTDFQIIDDILRLITEFTGIRPPFPRRYYMQEVLYEILQLSW